MRQSTRIIMNSAFLYGQQAADMLIQILLMGFILSRISDAAYGIFLLATTVQMAMSLVRNAISKGCVTQLARAHELRDGETICRVVTSASLFLIIPSVLAMVLSVVLAKPLAPWLNVTPDLYDTFVTVMWLSGLDVLLQVPLYPFRSVLEAQQRYGIVAAVQTASRFLRAGLIVASFLVIENDVLWVMVATVAADFLVAVAFQVMAYRAEPALRFRMRYFHWPLLAGMLVFSSFLMLSTAANFAAIEGSKWIVARLINVETVTYLGVTTFIILGMQRIVQTMTLVLVPVASQCQARGDQRRLGEMLVRGTRYAAISSFAIIAVLTPVMSVLLGLWLKPELAWLGPYAAVIGVVGAISLPGDTSLQILNGMGDSRRPFVAILIGSTVTVTSVIVTVGFLDLGLWGVIGSKAAGLAVMYTGLMLLALKSTGTSAGRLAWRAFIQPTIPAVGAGCVCQLLQWYLQPHSWLGLIEVCGPSLVVYGLLLLPFVARDEWNLARSALARIKAIGRPKPAV